MPERPSHKFGLSDVLLAMVVNLAWGMNIIGLKVTVGATAPFAAGAIRMLGVFILCLPWMRPPPGKIMLLVIFGTINGGFFVLFVNLALKVSTNVGALVIANQLAIPFALILGVLFLGERLSLGRISGVVLAFAGVTLVVFDPRIVDDLPGLLIMTVAAFFWALSMLLQRRLGGLSVPVLLGWTGLMGGIMLVPFSLAFEPGILAAIPGLNDQVIAWFAFSIIISTIVGQGCLAWLLRRHPVSTIAPLTLGSPVVAVVAAHLYFNTPITLLMIVGGALTLAGLLLVTLMVPPPAAAPGASTNGGDQFPSRGSASEL